MAPDIIATTSPVTLAGEQTPMPPVSGASSSPIQPFGDNSAVRAIPVTAVGKAARLTISVRQAGELLGIGRNQAYAAAKTGQLPTIKIGKRVLVPVIALEQMLAKGQPKVAAAEQAQ
jgi:excisionase family DNA binding protein